jgi:uncharacterized protein (DUF885 family)
VKKPLVSLILLFSSFFSACQPTQGSLPQQSPSPTASISLSPTAVQTLSDLSPTAGPVSVDVLDGNLPFDQFVEESFKLLLLRDPEAITIEGLSDMLGARNDRLNNLSISYIEETFALQRAIHDALQSYDRAALTTAQQVTYDTYAWYLDDLIRGQEFLYNDYPVNQMYTLGVQYVTEYLFTDYHPLETLEDAQDYITRLTLVKPKFEQLTAALDQRNQAGILAPRFVFEWSLGDIQVIAGSDAAETSFYTNLHDKLKASSAFTQGQRDQLEQQALDAVTASVIPAYQMLADAIEDLLKAAPRDDGVWQFDNGAAYYAYALRHFTSTDMTAEEIHQLGLSELDRIHVEMRQAFEQLGYQGDNALRLNFDQLAGASGLISGDQVVQRYETLIQTANQNLSSAFDIFPEAFVKVDRIPAGAAFYSAAALDGTRPGIFYAPVGGQQPIYNMATVAYHEAVPGHHFQIALQREMDLPLMRNLVVFNAYTEGWALYAERLAYEVGWYADDPYGNLGRLQYEAHRAARLVVDTGIHVKGWTFDQAVNFMVENTGLPEHVMQSEVARYIVWPGQATSYYIGYLKLLELRQQAQTQLGDAFDLVEFHHLILQTGSVPLDVMEDVVTAWLAEK